MKRKIHLKKITIARLSFHEIRNIRGGVDQGDSIPTYITEEETCIPTKDKNKCDLFTKRTCS